MAETSSFHKPQPRGLQRSPGQEKPEGGGHKEAELTHVSLCEVTVIKQRFPVSMNAMNTEL